MLQELIKEPLPRHIASLKQGLLDWGLSPAPATASKYPLLKSIQGSWIAAALVTLGWVPIILFLLKNQAGGGIVLLAGAGIVFAIFGIIQYWASLGKLVLCLTNTGYLPRLSPHGRELYMSSIYRSIDVGADRQTTTNRIVSALKADKRYRILKLDETTGSIEAIMVHGVLRLRDISFRVNTRDDGTTNITIDSHPSGFANRYIGAISVDGLPAILKIEEQIETGIAEPETNKALFKPGFVLTPAKYSLLIFAMIGAVYFGLGGRVPTNESRSSEADNALFKSDFDQALTAADQKIQDARVLADPEERASTLGMAYLNEARTAIIQVVRSVLKKKTTTVPSNSGQLHRLLDKAEWDLKQAIALDSNWSAPIAQLACVEALRGNQEKADSLMDTAIQVADKRESTFSHPYEDEQCLNSARVMVFHSQNDPVMAMLYLRHEDYCYGAFEMQDLQIKLAMLNNMADQHPRLSAEITALRSTIENTLEGQQFYEGSSYQEEEAQRELCVGLSLYCLLILLPAGVLTCLLKDWGAQPVRESVTREGKDPAQSPRPLDLIAQIEQSLNEETFWTEYMNQSQQQPVASRKVEEPQPYVLKMQQDVVHDASAG